MTEEKKVPAKRSRLVICNDDPVIVKPIIDNTWTVERISREAVPEGWSTVFAESKLELKQISDLLETDNDKRGVHFLPDCKNLFKAFELCPLSKVRVVIIGQDPYHSVSDMGSPIAEGLSFSVPKGTKVPPSLANIYKELKSSYPDFVVPNHGSLVSWAEQGVLLLNSCLTTRQGEAGAHSKFMLWLPFIVRVFDAINKVNPDCIYVMWGAEAQKVERYLGEKSYKLKAAHPSPFSANKGFFGCKHFIKINERLSPPINWQV